jgi:hypothetical protein
VQLCAELRSHLSQEHTSNELHLKRQWPSDEADHRRPVPKMTLHFGAGFERWVSQ